MDFRNLLWIGVAVVALGGCTPKVKSEIDQSTPDPVAQRTEDQVPEQFQHDGFDYYGLGSDRIQRYSYHESAAPDEAPVDGTGTQSVEFLGIEDGFPRYKITRDGSLNQFGTTTNVVKEDGVYALELLGVKLEEPILELPAKLEIGSRWPLELSADASPLGIAMSGESRVVARETITTPAGEFETLKIETEVEFEEGERTGTILITNWMAEGPGSVRSKLIRKSENLPTVEILVELIGFGEAEEEGAE